MHSSPNSLALAVTERRWSPKSARVKVMRGDLVMSAAHHVGEVRGEMVGLADRAGQGVVDGEHAAERLEGAEAEALGFVQTWEILARCRAARPGW